MTRKAIFDAVREAAPGDVFGDPGNILALDNLLDALGVPRDEQSARAVSPEGIAMMHKWEGLGKKRPDGKVEAYPDPGSRDGTPWTIGYGSTGPDIKKGTVWTVKQAEERFARDLAKFAKGVTDAIGNAPTTQGQYDAMVSLAYNIGLGAFLGSTLLRRHMAGRFDEAAKEFGRWVYNDGKVMQGLVNRRADERERYES